MRAPKQFLVCENMAHAAYVDALILSYLIEASGTQGTCWSGVWVRPGLLSDTYGVLWGSPGSDLFGTPEEEALLTIDTEEFDEDGESNWVMLPEPDYPESEI